MQTCLFSIRPDRRISAFGPSTVAFVICLTSPLKTPSTPYSLFNTSLNCFNYKFDLSPLLWPLCWLIDLSAAFSAPPFSPRGTPSAGDCPSLSDHLVAHNRTWETRDKTNTPKQELKSSTQQLCGRMGELPKVSRRNVRTQGTTGIRYTTLRLPRASSP